jgi:hypothetical protein
MQAARISPSDPHGAGIQSVEGSALPMPPMPPQNVMNREFIARNQIVERYLSGRLPLKGRQDFERYCHEHPELLDEIGLLERINAALRLLEAGGRAPPWEGRSKPWWERLPVLLGIAGVGLALGIIALVLLGKLSNSERSITSLRRQVAVRALDPALATHSYVIAPNRESPSTRSLLTIGGSQTEMADLKIDLSWTKMTVFRVTVDRVDQGRVAVFYNVLKDSNGVLHLGLNSSALGPGNYLFSIDGLNWRGEASPLAWATISIAH